MCGEIDLINEKFGELVYNPITMYVMCLYGLYGLDSFGLAKLYSFTKFAKLSPRQAFPLYSN